MIDAVKYFVIYLIISTVVSIAVLILGYVVCAIVGQPLLGIEEMLDQPWILSISLLLTNLLVVFIFWKKKYARLGFDYGYTYGEGFSSKKLYQWLVVATVGLLLFDLMGGFYLPIPDESEVMQYLVNMMRNPIGFITVCFIGPFAEEVLFRGAIERRLLQKNWNPWFAIVISALIFALAHFNFAQAFTATVIGIFMGWVYYRTRSIWPGVLIHMTNNTIATILALASPETMANVDFEMPKSLGYPLIAVSVILVVVATYFIAGLTKDRTPVPAPVTEVLPPPLPPMETSTAVPPETEP